MYLENECRLKPDIVGFSDIVFSDGIGEVCSVQGSYFRDLTYNRAGGFGMFV